MTAKQIESLIVQQYPFMFRNNRGGVKINNSYITYGIPQPPHGKKESDNAFKGSDMIGFIEIDGKAIFAAIEIKTKKDIIKPGQIKWLQFIANHGGIAQIWKEGHNENIEIEVIPGIKEVIQ